MSLQFPNTLNPGQCVTIPVDIKQSKDFLPTVTCAPIAALEVTDDRATICRGSTVDGTDMYSVHFKSELAGPFGAGVSRNYNEAYNDTSWFGSIFKPLNLAMAKLSEPEAYSRFVFEITPDSIALGRRKSAKSQSTEIYAVDNLDRATLVTASAIACWGYYAENTELIEFAKTLHNTKMGTPGTLLFSRDQIGEQKGTDLPVRDFAALNAQPHYERVPMVRGVAVANTAFPQLPTLIIPKTVAVDVKANDAFAANLNFAPINASQVTNDQAMLWTSGEELCARFKSEVGGPLGGFTLAPHLPTVPTETPTEQFSPYALCMNSAKHVYARRVSDNAQFKVDLPDRALLVIASALATVGYVEGNRYFKHVAEDIYAARGSMTTVGAELPAKDRLQAQTKVTYYSMSDINLMHSEMVSDYCTPRSSNYSLWKCAAAGMSSPTMP